MTHFYRFNWLALALLLILSGCTLRDSRRSVTFIIPQGYVGWIRVKYNISGAPPLPVKNGYYVALIPTSGLLKTSTVEEEGWGADTFYDVDKRGGKTQLISDGQNPNKVVWGDGGRTNERSMFIGTKQQFADAQRLIGGYDPGPLKLPITSQSEQKKP